MRMNIDDKKLKQFENHWGKLIERLPSIKTQAIYAAGKVLRQEVQTQVDQQGIVDTFYRVKRWQELSLGSKGGYAAVRPNAEEETQATWGGKAVKANKLTYWLEHGHAARKSSGRNPRYTPDIKDAVIGVGGAVVRGRMFYSWGRFYGADKALTAASRELMRIEDEWEWE